jgi:hypothetical protein
MEFRHWNSSFVVHLLRRKETSYRADSREYVDRQSVSRAWNKSLCESGSSSRLARFISIEDSNQMAIT